MLVGLLLLLMMMMNSNYANGYLSYSTHAITNDLNIYSLSPEKLETAAAGVSNVRGVLLLLHGCNHDAEDWFILPADCKLVNEALKQGLVAVSIPSLDRFGHRCWHPQDDTPRVMQAISYIRQTWGQDLPLFVAGASSGGMFATWLAQEGGENTFSFAGVASYIAAGLPPFLPISSKHPPIIFILMSEDHENASEDNAQAYIKRVEEETKSRGKDNSEKSSSSSSSSSSPKATPAFKSSILMCLPKAVTASWIHGYYPPWDSEFCTALITELQSDNIIDAKGILSSDPRTTVRTWKDALRRALVKVRPDRTKAEAHQDVEVLRELLNIAWGVHEMTGEHAAAVVDFLLSNAS